PPPGPHRPGCRPIAAAPPMNLGVSSAGTAPAAIDARGWSAISARRPIATSPPPPSAAAASVSIGLALAGRGALGELEVEALQVVRLGYGQLDGAVGGLGEVRDKWG